MDCIFCEIVRGNVPSDKVYEDELVVAFRDIRPEAPVHVLIAPREHLAGIADAEERHAGLLGRLLLAAKGIARSEGVADAGFRLVVNQGDDGGQAVQHLHLHLLGGRKLRGLG